MTEGRKPDAPSHKLDIDLNWYSAFTGLRPAASLSCESLLSDDDGEENPLKTLDYSKFMERAVPNYDVHKSIHCHDGERRLIQDCPWCNHHYFEWLWANGDVRIVKQLDGASFTVYRGGGEEEGDGGDDGDIHSESRYTFKHFLSKNKRQRAKRKASWIEHSKDVRKEIDAKSVAQVVFNPTQAQFARRPGSGGQEGVRDWVSRNCRAHCLPEDMDTYTVDRNLFFLPNDKALQSPDAPKYLIMCFDNLIPQDVQDGLWTRWRNMREQVCIATTNENRDEEPQLHLGIWSHYKMFPYVTSDTKQKGPVECEINAFLSILKTGVMRRVWNALKRHDPETLERHVRANEHLQNDVVFMDILKDRPEVDFGGMFYTVAVKEGGSQTVHLDWKDHPGSYSWVMTVGPGWEGGEICFPQLGIKIATRARQVIAFRGRQLAHFAAASTPGRLAITGFTDELTMKRALEGLPSQPPPKKVGQKAP